MKLIVSLLGAALLMLARADARAAETYARITSIHVEKANVIVEVQASAKLGKVTLESSTRVGRKAWEPRGVQVVKPGAAADTVNLTFTVPISPAVELLRVRGDFADNMLPPSFYEGTNKFIAATGGGGGTGAGAGGGAVMAAPGAADKNSAPETEDQTRSVVESDIWKIDGDTLYFFNQNRGLQVIDVSNPDNPVLTGTYDLPASGEDMYLLGPGKIALLAQDNCSWYGNSVGSHVVLLQVKNGVPQLINALPVAGYIAESRLVGSALYVVANSYEQHPGKDGSTEWEWGSRVVSFDLSDFNAAQKKSEDWVTGYGNVIYATDQNLFVAQSIWDYRTGSQNSLVTSYDISSPDGKFAKLATFDVVGAVQDKFKMQMNNGIFSVVVQVNSRQPRASYIKTFSMADPQKPQQLAEVKIVENEQLYATRFDGNRLYAVTFFRIDPLWIFDLSDPAAPKRLGELQIPGWSTYLRPLGDNLLAIGLDTNGTTRVAVQLFNVADAANPTLLSKVLLGEQWSYSEANWDEKAFGVLPDDNLVLVPFSSGGNSTYTQGVQIIDLVGNSLTKRGVIEQNLTARRATVHRGRILSISSQELLSVNATDRDHPTVVKSTELAWEADRVHLAGDYVIEVDANGSDGSPALRVVRADDSWTLVKTVALKKLPYMGSVTIEGKLFVLQGKPIEVIYPEVYNPTNWFPISTNPASFLLSEFDLGALPELPLLNSTTKDNGTNYFYGQYEAIQVKPNVLVWRSRNSGFYPWWGGPGGPIMALARQSAGVAAPVDIAKVGVGVGDFRPIWFGGASGHFIVIDPTTLTFSSEVLLSSTNGWWNFGDAFAIDGRIYTSHQASEWDETIDPPPYESSCYDTNTGSWHPCVIDPPPGYWVQRYYLDVVDFNDPTDPLVRKPANLPGTLIGAARNGELLYTRGYNIKPFDNGANDEMLAASSYDGVEAHLITTMAFNENWPRPTASIDQYLYLGAAPSKADTNATLQVWTLNNSGKFELLNSQVLDTPAQQFKRVKDILAVQTSDILLMDARTPTAPKLIGAGHSNACYGVLLDGADGSVDRGLWVPVGWYGVLKIPVKTP